MTKIVSLLAALSAMLAQITYADPAHALNTKSWVTGLGSDSNPCTRPFPCATFAHAIQQTSSGGEIGVVDSGEYGGNPTGIDRSISITNDGAGDALFTVGANALGLLVLASAGDVVSLRGLTINGSEAAAIGISYSVAAALHIQNCVIKNFEDPQAGTGIQVPANGTQQMFISDTLIYNNGGALGDNGVGGGILVSINTTGTEAIVLDRVHLENNVFGLKVDNSQNTMGNGVHVVVRDSVISGNAASGIIASLAPGAKPVIMFVEHSSIVNNGNNGVLADGQHAVVILNDNTITRNGTGIKATNGGQLISYGNNKNNNNVGAEGAPTSTFSQM